jgi:predicted unusual protein kinase regulating ubiquinone biosynthesis (AarF/ABC1/UbiB family)
MCKPDEKGLSDPADGNEGIEKLRSELAALKSRCGKLEAQAYVEVAQQLDLLVQLVTFGLSVASFLLYWNILGWFLTFAVYAGNLLVSPSTGDFLFHTYSIIAFKLASASIPILRHRWYHRIDYRRLEVFAVFGVFIARVKLCRWREALFAPKEGSSSSKDNQFGAVITEEDIWEASYEVNAQFLYASILRLRGLWIKTAQYLSSRADFAPKAYVRHLSKLQDEAPETEWEEVEKMLKRAGILDQFSSVEKKPIASASIGQVHFATLKKTGEKVVVKVQHPQARTLLLDDFWSLTVITRIVSYLEPEWAFLEKLMAEWAKEAHKELSFTSEMEHLLLAKVAIDTLDKDATTSPGTGAMPFKVEIPIPYPELTSRDVLVMSYCEGAKVDDLDQLEKWNLPKGAVMDAVAQAFAHMMYAADIFNGDPHAGNILVRPGLGNTIDSQGGGLTIVLLDWGLAKQLPQEKRIALCKLCLAAATFDFGMLLDSFKAMGLKMKRVSIFHEVIYIVY